MENLPNYVLRKQSKFFWGAWNYYCRQTYFFQAWFTFTFDNSCPPRAGHDLSFTPQVRPVFATAGMLWEGHWTGGHKWWRNLGSYQKWGKQSSTQKYSSNVLESTSSKRCKTFFEQCDQEGMDLLKWCWRYWHALQYHSHSTTKPDKQHIHTTSTTKDNQQYIRYISIRIYKQLNSSEMSCKYGFCQVSSYFSVFSKDWLEEVSIVQKPVSLEAQKRRGQVSLNEFIKWYAETWAAWKTWVRMSWGGLVVWVVKLPNLPICFDVHPTKFGEDEPMLTKILSDELRAPTSCIFLCCSVNTKDCHCR